MVKKLQKLSNEKKKKSAELPRAIKDSAQQIWLAGLGAFAKAQEEGSKVFETLVKEGMSMQRKTQTVAEEKITEATSRVTHMANDIGSRAAGQWDKLESIFEDRVAKALSRLGVPTSRDLEALNARIDALTQSVGKAPAAAKPAAKKPAAKKPATAKAASAPKQAAAKRRATPLQNPPPRPLRTPRPAPDRAAHFPGRQRPAHAAVAPWVRQPFSLHRPCATPMPARGIVG